MRNGALCGPRAVWARRMTADRGVTLELRRGPGGHVRPSPVRRPRIGRAHALDPLGGHHDAGQGAASDVAARLERRVVDGYYRARFDGKALMPAEVRRLRLGLGGRGRGARHSLLVAGRHPVAGLRALGLRISLPRSPASLSEGG